MGSFPGDAQAVWPRSDSGHVEGRAVFLNRCWAERIAGLEVGQFPLPKRGRAYICFGKAFSPY